ncbi:glycosyltransferase family 4 protein [Ornithinimicrobium ciconiae]|uniref:Glycosyltransferase family 4 protein n=2 Tax=Ornithinimicrobium ciconiae TaxID=2594265 RepID=A0A516GF85_9MICO|nr:glycosyltransferase family 4 protein [Ornithinimicrobium ciconiae]
MGAQAYEHAIRSRARAALADAPEQWVVHDVVARSLRSPLEGNRRLPMGWLFGASPAARRALGRAIYPRGSVVHRMDLILPPPPGPDVVTLHDVVAWEFDDESDPVQAAPEELRRADAVVCVSQFTAERAETFLGVTDPVVVPNGVSQDYFEAAPLAADVLESLGLRTPYLLYAGGSARRKNLPALAEAWRLVSQRRPEWQLALAGPTNPERQSLFAGAPRVVHLGRLADELMAPLMAGAGAAVVPSLYEGFGLPALEAMAARVPLVASNRSSLPEVVADGGTLVDPTPEALAEGIEFVTSGDAGLRLVVERGRARAAEFTWEQSAAGHAKVWRQVAGAS